MLDHSLSEYAEVSEVLNLINQENFSIKNTLKLPDFQIATYLLFFSTLIHLKKSLLSIFSDSNQQKIITKKTQCYSFEIDPILKNLYSQFLVIVINRKLSQKTPTL